MTVWLIQNMCKQQKLPIFMTDYINIMGFFKWNRKLIKKINDLTEAMVKTVIRAGVVKDVANVLR